MDVTKNTGFYGRVEVYGISQPELFEGTIQQIALGFINYLKVTQVRTGPNGKEIRLIISDQKLKAEKANSLDLDDPEMQRLYSELTADAIQMSDEEIEALYHPSARDPNYERFRYLQATQSNFLTAPDEYEQLWKHFESLWPEVTANLKRRSVL